MVATSRQAIQESMIGRLNRFYDSRLVKLSNQLLNEFILFRINFLMISSKSIDGIYGAKIPPTM